MLQLGGYSSIADLIWLIGLDKVEGLISFISFTDSK